MKNDLIRRQDVLHELDGCDYELKDWQRWKLKTMVRDIPSAEKAQLSEEDATKDATSGLISRKEAIDAILSLTNCDTVEGLRVYVMEHDLGSWWSGGVLSSIGKVERLPSAEPERKKGEWIQRPRYDGDTQPMLECPYCQNKVGWWDLARYCDSCGARLKGSAGDLDE